MEQKESWSCFEVNKKCILLVTNAQPSTCSSSPILSEGKSCEGQNQVRLPWHVVCILNGEFCEEGTC